MRDTYITTYILYGALGLQRRGEAILGSGLANVKAAISEADGVKKEVKKGRRKWARWARKGGGSCWARLQTIVGSICMYELEHMDD